LIVQPASATEEIRTAPLIAKVRSVFLFIIFLT
jgi:hypothetical protein